MEKEYEALKRNNTWEKVQKFESIKLLDTKWVYKTKKDENNESIYKARLVAKGFAQTHGIDYNETYSPVVKYSSIRYLLALATEQNLKVDHMDVATAYLNGDLEENIYVRPPKELESLEGTGQIWKLRKTIYGEKTEWSSVEQKVKYRIKGNWIKTIRS